MAEVATRITLESNHVIIAYIMQRRCGDPGANVRVGFALADSPAAFPAAAKDLGDSRRAALQARPKSWLNSGRVNWSQL